MSKRDHINMETKLAATLLALGHIPYEHSKLMTAAQIISLYHFHHNILHSTEPINEPWNIEPMLLVKHRERFPIDAAVAAKIKRLRGETGTAPKQKIPARANPWPQGRKIQNRGFRSAQVGD